MNVHNVTIRDLFWLAVTVALGLAWWADHERQVAQVESLLLRLQLPAALADELRMTQGKFTPWRQE